MALLDYLRPRTAFAKRPTEQADPPKVGAAVGTYGETSHGVGYIKHLGDRLAEALSSTELDGPTIARMRKHPQVSACLSVLATPFLRAEYVIEHEDDEIREWLEQAYAKVADAIHASAARRLWAGYSPNVLVWQADPDLGGYTIEKIRDLHPATVRALVDEWGGYAGLVQHPNTEHKVIIDDPRLTLWLVEQMESGNLYGRNPLEAAREPWADQLAVRLFHARYLERFGEPVVVGRAPTGQRIANQAEINDAISRQAEDATVEIPAPVFVDNQTTIAEIATNLRHHSSVTLPSEREVSADGKPLGFAWDLTYLEATRSGGSEFLDAIAEKDRKIARGLFIPDLLFSNNEGGGAYALGKEHRDVFTDGTQARLDDLGRQITDHVINRLLRVNFGDDVAPGRLTFAPLADETRSLLWELAKGLMTDAKVVDLVEIAGRLGVPLADGAVEDLEQDDDEDVVEAEVVEPDPQDPDAEQDLAHSRAALTFATAGRATFAKPGNVDGLPEWKVPQAYDPPPFRRELTDRERRVPFAKIEGGMNAAEAETIDALVALLEDSRARVTRQIEGVLKRDTEADVIAAIGTIEVGSTSPYATAWTKLIREVWTIGLEAVAAELGEDAGVPVTLGPVARAVAKALADNAAESVVSRLTTSVRREVLDAYRSGIGKPGIIAAVADLYAKTSAGEAHPLRLTTRELSSKALNQGRADAIQRGGVPLAGAQYSALLDRRTCDLCERLDEQTVSVKSLDFVRYTPPVHHNCRCVWIFVVEGEEGFEPDWQGAPASMVDRFGGMIY